MRDKKLILLLAVPSLILIGLIVFRKETHVSATKFIPPSDLQRSAKIWNDRQFSDVTDEATQVLIQELLTPLNLSEAAKKQALYSCWEMLRAYSHADWELFLSVRAPVEGYEIHPDVKDALAQYAPKDAHTSTSLGFYRALWLETFQHDVLFTKVAFVSNSITLVDLPSDTTSYLGFPVYVEKTNQNWMTSTPTLAFDYSKVLADNLGKKQTTKALKFFFFGGGNDTNARPFMIVFSWDERDSKWIPRQFSHANASQPKQIIRFF